MPALRINGVDLAYDEAGQGPALLLLHAGIADRRMWRDVLPTFASTFRTVAPDLRAYGDTPIPDDPFCWTADVLGLMDALGIERAHLVGVSMSGQVALDLVLAHPERVDRVVLVATGIPHWDYSQQMRDNNAAEMRAIEAGEFDEAAWTEVRVWLDGPHRSADELDPQLRRRVFEMQRHAYEIDNENAELRWLVDEPREQYPEITAPTLVLAGALDQPDIRQIAPVLAREIPGAAYRELEGVAHLPPMEDPATFASVVTDFLLGR
jgi:3-oxoadipate enol-lactonase